MLIPLLMNLNMFQSGVIPPEPPVVPPTPPVTGGGGGKARGRGKRPQYWWEASYKELRELPLPQEEESNEVAQEVLARLQAVWRDLDHREVKFQRMLAECERLEKLTATYIQFHAYTRLLDETKQRIQAAEDARIARAAAEEESEVNEILDLL